MANARAFAKFGLSKDNRMIVEVLEEILDELKSINRNNQKATPSPS